MEHNATPLVARESVDSTALFGTSIADCNDIEQLRAIAEKLWSLLDDIDTASDMFKPSDKFHEEWSEFYDLAGYRLFYGYALKKAADRFKQLESDGHHLYLPNDLAKRSA